MNIVLSSIKYQPPNPEYKRIQIRKNVFENTYSKKIDITFETFENPRLRYRFAEAIDDAKQLCANASSDECFSAWDEVDELEDSMMRAGLNLFPYYSMRYGSLLRRNFKYRFNIRNVEDHHIIPLQFRHHPLFDIVNYDLNSGNNIIMMPREIGNLRKNRITHNGPHYKYNKFVGDILDSMMYMKEPEPEFKQFVDFLKTGCRFRPQDIPWN
tara:strand:- start:855 stop:1490 length:636 start_codon:yes stop_codon:yes gene_type:complete